MSHHNWTVGTAAAIAAVVAVTLAYSPNGLAQKGDPDDSDSRIQRGFDIAPVHLDLKGKNRALVGLGSYLVNGAGDCNGCHSGPLGEYADGGNPFLGQPKIVNQAAYLSGGTPRFGPVFIPRNLTPDKATGLPEGGATWQEFFETMRTGFDHDQAHAQISPLLQVMPWPNFQNMTDRDLRAIYEYLSAIPCLEGDPGLPHPRPIGTRCK